MTDVSASVSMAFSGGGISSTASGSFTFSSEHGFYSGVQTIPMGIVTAIDLHISECYATVALKNLSDEFFCDIVITDGATDFYFARLQPGRIMMLPSIIADGVYMVADAASGEVDLHVIAAVESEIP